MTAWPDWRREAGFGVYLHWPFCEAKCPYCDFNSHVVAQVDQDRWARAFCAEIDRAAERCEGRVLNSIYFGGGTPSLMRADTVDKILAHLRGRFPFANDIEITLEANPSSIEIDRFAGYRQAGVNRVSMGVQSLNNDDLRALGRLHDRDQALRGLQIGGDTFDRVSFDLIYGRQNQSLDAWERELREALSLQNGHLSLYQLTIEPGTAFHRRYAAGGLAGLPDEDLGADLYELTEAVCIEHGLVSYEVSNYARPGQESRHNLLYWRGGDYLGIGPGAHGRISDAVSRIATETPLAPGAWLAKAEGSGATRDHPLTQADQRAELLMMGLRLRGGVDVAALVSLGGDLSAPRWSDAVADGLIENAPDRVSTTERGRLLLNEVVRRLIN